MERNIIAIGGGNVASGETLSIDQELVSLTGSSKPRLLFIPTASYDSVDYFNNMKIAYGGRLNCSVDVLRVWEHDTEKSVIAEKIHAAEVIYVGGGNTKAMIARWQELGVDQELKAFVDAGKPVGGLSAGAICWFRVGNSDWPQFENIPNVNTARLDCLGFVDLVACPHTGREPFRIDEFTKMMETETGVGIGLDDCCAIQIKGETYRLLASIENVGAHLIYRKGNQILREFLQPHDDFRPISELQARSFG